MTNYVANLTHQYACFRDEAERLAGMFETDANVDTSGVVVWNSNGAVPPADVLDLWKHLGKRFDYEASTAERQRQTDRAIAAYQRRMAERTPEEIAEQRAEARAALGPGHRMVNVITGERYTT